MAVLARSDANIMAWSCGFLLVLLGRNLVLLSFSFSARAYSTANNPSQAGNATNI
jgi:hypothetical protein